MSKINPNVILRYVGLILLIEALSNLICIPVALGFSESILPFVWPALITIIPGLLILWLLRGSVKDELTNNDSYLIVILTWIILSVTGTLPYLFSNTSPRFMSAVFESVSGYTTTGSTVFPDVEHLPYSILFWRSLTQWVGGLCVLAMVVAILPVLQIGGHILYSNDFSLKGNILFKTRSVTLNIILIYFALTIAELICLLAGGMKFFDSLCITFGTVSTGGFSVKNNSLASYTPYLQYIVSLFMFLSATSYIVLLFSFRRDFRKIKANNEFWFYTLTTIISIIFITTLLFSKTDRDFSTSLRHSVFQVVSQISTTGFATTDYTTWPVAAYFFMFLLLFAGGCTISTAGGIKMARHLLIFRNMKILMVKLQHPNSVIPIKLNGRIVHDDISNNVILFLLVYILFFIFGSFVLILTGIPVNEALGGSATALANVGPGLGISGNMGNFSAFNDPAMITMSVLMIAGRIELFSLFVLFTKAFWKR
jgi:trk system potassium uptake protein